MFYRANTELRFNDLLEVSRNSASLQIAGESFWSMPIRLQNWVVIGSMTGRIWGWNMDTEVCLQLGQMRGPIYSSPLLVDSDIVMASDAGELTRLRFSNDNGLCSLSEVWRIDVGNTIHGTASLMLDQETLLVPVYNEGVRLVDVASGATKRIIDCLQGVDEDPYATPIAISETEFVVGSQKSLLQFNILGQTVACYETGGLVDASACFHPELGVVCFGSEDGKIRVVDIKARKLVSEYQTGSAIFASPAISGNHVLFGNQSDSLFSIDLLTYQYSKFTLDRQDPAAYSVTKRNRLNYTAISADGDGFHFVDGLGRYIYIDPKMCTQQHVGFKRGAHTSPLVCPDAQVILGGHFGDLYRFQKGDSKCEFL